jgi:hypothetical protein
LGLIRNLHNGGEKMKSVMKFLKITNFMLSRSADRKTSVRNTKHNSAYGVSCVGKRHQVVYRPTWSSSNAGQFELAQKSQRRGRMKAGKYLAAATILAVCMGPVARQAVAQDGQGRNLRATLRGFNETPANSTPATGEFHARISDDESSITFELTYSGLVADSLFAHIHLGQKNVAGGVMIFFCDNTSPSPHSPRTCPARAGTVTGTVTAADVIGPNGQGIAPGEFSKVLQAIRAGVSYANVHSTKFPAGEIRGQVRVVDEDEENQDRSR